MRATSTPKEAGPKNEALVVVALNIENEGVKEVWGGRIKEEEEEEWYESLKELEEEILILWIRGRRWRT